MKWLALAIFLLAGCGDLVVGSESTVPDLAPPDAGACDQDAFSC